MNRWWWNTDRILGILVNRALFELKCVQDQISAIIASDFARVFLGLLLVLSGQLASFPICNSIEMWLILGTTKRRTGVVALLNEDRFAAEFTFLFFAEFTHRSLS